MSIPLLPTQKAWRVVGKGSPSEVVRLDNVAPIPTQLSKGDVLVKVQAAALNPAGYKLMDMLPGFILKRPYVPEYDLAGVIVDTNGSEFNNGDEVFGFLTVSLSLKTRQGTLAQYTYLPASHLVRRPANVPPTRAAGVPLTAMTAYQALFEVGHLEPEQRVFINGGSTAVGSFAIQLAKAIGCKVTASASGKNEEYVRSLGADEFVDYTKAPLHSILAAEVPSPKYQVFLEAVGLLDTSLYTNSEAYLAPNGTFVSVGPQPKGFDVIGIGRLLWKVYLQPRWLGGTRRTWKMVQVANKREDMEKIAQFLIEGKLKPVVDSVYSFEDVPKAYERCMTGQATGKIIIKVDPNAE
ncbi:NAD(P)-binding protein [Laetiporus sulphureus 93-53]|uniref:NAD(P)-binding protein n=1 Tax=Laetiporus sulphureus 93-53 TaxID=1314785 RepID=A0A165HAG3_9APHY|nr:NAD(P)-binding protein [Laetiporus sulphureus 93-53]KZT11465.1 NAD(P)-binding protein [Laetiporus sulphureus 93-53]